MDTRTFQDDSTLSFDEESRAIDHLRSIIATRGKVMMRHLDAEDLPPARILITTKFIHSQLFDPVQRAGSYFLGHLTLNPEVIHSLTDREIGHVVDHELAHYVQLRRNKRVTITEKMLHPGEYMEFKEGFATFASSLTNGGVERPIRESLERAFSGRKPDPDMATYVRGYLRFFAIAKANSADEAIRCGLSSSLAEWRGATSRANEDLGLSTSDSLFWT